MDQVHKRFTTEQVRVLLKGYCQGTLDRLAIEEILGIGKTRFFALFRQYRRGMGDEKVPSQSSDAGLELLYAATYSQGRYSG